MFNSVQESVVSVLPFIPVLILIISEDGTPKNKSTHIQKCLLFEVLGVKISRVFNISEIIRARFLVWSLIEETY